MRFDFFEIIQSTTLVEGFWAVFGEGLDGNYS